MKKIAVFLVPVIILIVIIAARSSNGSIIWRCPADEKIRSIRTSDTPGKLFVTTEKDGNWVFREVYDSGKSKILITGTGKVSPFSHFVPRYDYSEYLMYGYKQINRLFIFDTSTGKKQSLGVKGDYSGFHQPLSPDGKFIALIKRVYDKKQYKQKIIIHNRKSGSIHELNGVDNTHFNYLTWTHNGLFLFNSESGIFYKGDENGVKPILKAGFSHLGFVTPDGSELVLLKHDINETVILEIYDLQNKYKINGIFRKSVVLKPEEKGCLMFIVNSIQYSQFSDEMVFATNWPPLGPVYISKNRKCKEVSSLARDKGFVASIGAAIWKPGEIAYVTSQKGKKYVIYSRKMN
ncbi:MAG: hypothetical protein ACYC0V_10475 [Armatimonadota bacterium]